MIITKIEAAEAQLETAIQLFFQNGNPIPVETLCAAALGILRPIVSSQFSAPTLLDFIHLDSKQETKRLHDLINKTSNFLKHSGRDPTKTLDYNPDALPLMLMEASSHCRKVSVNLRRAKNRALVIYDMWFSLNYPHIINQRNPHWVGIVNDLKAVGASKEKRFFLALLLNRADIALSTD